MMNRRYNLSLEPYEAHHSSLCVALVYGMLGGGSTALAVYLLGSMLPSWIPNVMYAITAGIVGFVCAWIVCERAFPNAHKWYHGASWAHRAYDMAAVLAAVGAYYLMA